MQIKERISKWINIIMIAVICAFAGASVITYIYYKAHPEVFAVTSAPWYYVIFEYAIYAVIILIICLIVKLIIKKKRK